MRSRMVHMLGGLTMAAVLGGCGSVAPARSSPAPALFPVPAAPSPVAQPAEPVEGEIVPPPPPPGTVFGKTFFKGVLKTSYVKLSLIDLSDETKQYQLFIGEQLGPSLLPWNSRSVQPGYFFLELPAGLYRIYSISIPVGSTTATEDVALVFSVSSEEVTYIGTLLVNGVNEKVKFGGVPLIVPGFDYELSVLDERQEAVREFRHRYPLLQEPVRVELLRDEGKVNHVP
jgi:hypothetical protein